MPYIAQETANKITDNGKLPSSKGELTYVLTEACAAYVNRRDDVNYDALADVLACLESTKLEFYRRSIVPYEDWKKEVNGDTRQLASLVTRIRNKIGRSTT